MAACTGPGPVIDGPINYRVVGGLGGAGDGRGVHLDLDGKATITGGERGLRVFMLDEAQLDLVHAGVYSARLDLMKPNYTSCCDRYVDQVSVQLDGEPITVHADQGSTKAPQLLTALVDVFDAIIDL